MGTTNKPISYNAIKKNQTLSSFLEEEKEEVENESD